MASSTRGAPSAAVLAGVPRNPPPPAAAPQTPPPGPVARLERAVEGGVHELVHVAAAHGGQGAHHGPRSRRYFARSMGSAPARCGSAAAAAGLVIPRAAADPCRARRGGGPP